MARLIDPRIAWTLGLAALVMALSIALVRERGQGAIEQARLEEARAESQRESDRARALADQMSTLRDQVAALGDRVSGLERDNRVLRRRLASSRRPHTELAALASSIAAVAPAVEASASMPSVEAHLVGEASPLEGFNLMPSREWPVIERLRITAPSGLADPAFMKKMYVGYVLLQAADIGTTVIALQRGGQEVNPLLRGISGHPAALVTVKAATSAGTLLIVKKLHQKQPVVAAVTLAAINSTLAVVAARNARAIKAQKQP